MGIRMVATDLDRTLLRKDRTLSEYTVAVFRRCREKGLKIAFATSRPMSAVVNFDFCTRIAPDAATYHGGAAVYAGGVRVERNGIPPETVHRILSSAYREMGVKLAVEVDNKFYGNFVPLDMWPNIEVNLIDFDDLPMIPADKIVFTDLRPAVIESISRILPEGLYLETSEDKIGMIMNRNATKAKGVARIAEYFGIALSDIVAFGDDYNDIGMLRECGVGVAVANGIDEAKAAADEVCEDNDSDGVAKWLDKNILY